MGIALIGLDSLLLSKKTCVCVDWKQDSLFDRLLPSKGHKKPLLGLIVSIIAQALYAMRRVWEEFVFKRYPGSSPSYVAGYGGLALTLGTSCNE